MILSPELVRYCKGNGIDFISNYYSTKNKALNTRCDQSDPYKINPMLAETYDWLVDAHEREIIKPELEPRDIADDMCMLCKGNIFEWCLADGNYEMEANVARIINIYINSILNS